MTQEKIAAEYRQCSHGFHHPPWPHSCDGCWCEGERDRREYGWDHDTTPERRLPPEGWHDLGTHADRPDANLEFSTEVDENGLPRWERLIENREQDLTENLQESP